MILCIFWYEDLKIAVLSFTFKFVPTLKKNRFLLKKFTFGIRFLKICQHNLNVSVFNLKILNLRSKPQETQHSFFLYINSLRGEFNFKAPPEELATTYNQLMSPSEASDTHTQCLW